jgi:hypothetical protein
VFLNNVVLTEAGGPCGQVVTVGRYCCFAFAALFVVLSGFGVSYLIYTGFQAEEPSVWENCCAEECGDYTGGDEPEDEDDIAGQPPAIDCDESYGYPNTTTTKVQVRRLDKDGYEEDIPLRDHFWGIGTTTTTSWLHEQRQNTSYSLRGATALAVNSSIAEQKAEELLREDVAVSVRLLSARRKRRPWFLRWLTSKKRWMKSNLRWLKWFMAEQKAEEPLREDIAAASRLLSARRKRRPWFLRWLA